MKNKIWLEYELQKRDEIAAQASKLIASSKHPRTMVKVFMPQMLEYEILPNIVWDGQSDDDIREFAKFKISPPRRLSQAARIEYFNKFPILTVHQCIMVLINVEPGTMVRTKAEAVCYVEILELAQSYADDHQEPFCDGCDTEPFIDYKIDPDKFYVFTQKNGYSIPKGWMFRTQVKKTPEVGSPKWHMHDEAVAAGIAMAEAGNPPTQLSNELVTYIRSHPNTYEQCSKTQSDDTLLRYIRETGDPRDDERYIKVLSSINSAQKQ